MFDQDKLSVIAIHEPGGNVTIRVCRRKPGSPEADAAPLVVKYGVFDVPLSLGEMRNLHEALTLALWERLPR